MATSHPTLTVVINTKNSAPVLAQALQSVIDLADEIIVMDMQSRDETQKIARDFGAKVFTHPDVGYVEPARNAAIARSTSDWVLVLDADEEVPPSLAQKIQTLIQSTTVDAYFLPRQNIIFGKKVETGWWPDFILRLFRRGHVRWSDELHAVPEVTGTIDRLEPKESLALIHHNYQTIDQFVDRAQRYAGIEAEELEGEEAVPQPVEAFFSEFLQRYYGWGGREDGAHGVMLSLLQGLEKVVVHAKLWENQRFPGTFPQKSVAEILEQAADDARFWEAHYAVQRTHGLIKIWWKIRRKLRI